jgi:hypothetical protein
MLDGARPAAAATDHHRLGDRHNRTRARWQQLLERLDPSAPHAILAQVQQQRIKPRFAGQQEALGLRRSLEGSAEMECDVEVQHIAPDGFQYTPTSSVAPLGPDPVLMHSCQPAGT